MARQPRNRAADADMPHQAIRPQEYARGVGWAVGDRAPSNAYRATDTDGVPVGPVLYEAPAGRGTLIVAEGTQISPHAARLLDVPPDDDAEPVEG
ncbi:hypothetical protein ACIBSV_12115 [Embleya sp. NPDC050154]|uniref:hypothetical protein n=1 Tax=Embleya sp. NPDC050154 TaxID=3363988 RepID=UPI0037B292FA